MKDRGFTLVELLVVVSIIFLVLSLGFQAFVKGFGMTKVLQSQTTGNIQVEYFFSELAYGNKATMGKSLVSQSPSAITVNPTEIRYSDVAYRLTGSTIVRTIGGVSTALVTDVTSLSFVLSGNLVDVSIKLKHGKNPYKLGVCLRNGGSGV